mmetsp:Transcript_23175/g.65430  ORF Transcript_23175/g.65430 Transcript_23175/m.65430 type:complete len:246 (-) Transcript_23175:455-1192(-)
MRYVESDVVNLPLLAQASKVYPRWSCTLTAALAIAYLDHILDEAVLEVVNTTHQLELLATHTLQHRRRQIHGQRALECSGKQLRLFAGIVQHARPLINEAAVLVLGFSQHIGHIVMSTPLRKLQSRSTRCISRKENLQWADRRQISRSRSVAAECSQMQWCLVVNGRAHEHVGSGDDQPLAGGLRAAGGGQMQGRVAGVAGRVDGASDALHGNQQLANSRVTPRSRHVQGQTPFDVGVQRIGALQ